MTNRSVGSKLTWKIMSTFLLLLMVVSVIYVLLTYHFTSKFFEESLQKLNAQVANHLIEEKFQDSSPFLEDGSTNKALFGDIMHDMMAVNRGIEVYLLDESGVVLYSVVLDHDRSEKDITRVNLAPIQKFLKTDGQKYVLGDDPRDTSVKKIFSAAPYSIDGHDGYIYIILASKQYEEVTSSLIGSYFLRIGLGASLATVIFAAIIGLIVIWYLTKNLRTIIYTVKRFRDGDMKVRLPDPKQSDLSILAATYNDMADTISKNIDDLKSVEALRRELIANVSHDLRTPLAIMSGYVETLQIKSDRLNADERSEYLDIIQSSIHKLSNLVNQLFEYSKLEANQIEVMKEPFQMADLAFDVHRNFLQLAKEKDISISLEVEEKLPLVFADISLVERIIQNLMDNAIKYSHAGGKVVIALHADNDHVNIAVKDSGPGIPLDEQEHIFERYRRSELTKEKVTGTGIGLAIVKKIIELHQSTIKVTSLPDKGTVFQFYLPAYQG